jgi:adenylate kinase
MFYWEMGAILRQLAKEDNELARKVKSIIDKGDYLSDELLIEVVKDRLATIPTDKTVIFDGIPRRIGQAEFLFDFLNKIGKKNFITVFIDLPEEESFKRLFARAEKEGRADDTEEAIRSRLKLYYEVTVPVLEYLKGRSKFIEIDGRPAVEEVENSINQKLGMEG